MIGLCEQNENESEIKNSASFSKLNELNLDKIKGSDAFQESPLKRTEQIFTKMDLDKNGN